MEVLVAAADLLSPSIVRKPVAEVLTRWPAWCPPHVRKQKGLPCILAALHEVCEAKPDQVRMDGYEKARVHAYIASSNEPGLKIGEAVKAGVLQVSSPAFDSIRDILRASIGMRSAGI